MPEKPCPTCRLATMELERLRGVIAEAYWSLQEGQPLDVVLRDLLNGHGHLPAFRPADRTIAELIEASSLGTPEAKALRERTPPEVVDRIMERVEELSSRCGECGGRLVDSICEDCDTRHGGPLSLEEARRVDAAAGVSPITEVQYRRYRESFEAEPSTHDLIVELRETLGLFAGAMPVTPKQAWDEAILRVRQLTEGR